MAKDPEGKRPFGQTHLRWEDLIKRDVESLKGDSDWKTIATGREIGCATGRFKWPVTKKEKKKIENIYIYDF